MRHAIKIGLLCGALACLGAGCRTTVIPAPPTRTPPIADAQPLAPPTRVAPLSNPIEGALGRVTKKGFGLKVAPGDSPVSPERFSGYHTGVDFETTPDEQDADVAIHAACDGTLALKEYASGYGGVAVERCRVDGADVTVIYGHLRLSSVSAKSGQALKAGKALGVLGTGYSKETDGERKHLHFGVHKGSSVDIKGYVQRLADLEGWIDPLTLLK